MKILLKNGKVITDKVMDANVYIADGKIIDITQEAPDVDETVDCSDCFIVPGLIDMHTHLREPGQEYKETLLSGAEAAIHGGVTTLCCMANTSPVIDNSSVVSWIVKRSAENALADVLPFGCVTKGMKGEDLTEMGDLLEAGACGFSDDGRPVMSGEVMRRSLEYSKYFNAFIACHEEESTLFNKGSINEGRISTITGLRAAPAEAESAMVARDIELARLTGGRVHICHVSSRHSVDLIRRGKEAGINVTAEVTPNHLSLTDEICLGYDTATKVNPPLRSDEDRQALIQAVKDGTIDCIASDHAPHHRDDKFVEYDLAAFGMIGLQLIVPLLIDLIDKGSLTWVDFARITSEKPAKILNLQDKGTLKPHMKADITIIDPHISYVFDETINKSLSSNTPFWGKTLKGKARAVFKDGRRLI